MAFDFGNANEAQRSAISTIDGPLLIIAGPGTGKTYTLVKRIVYLITEKDVLPEEIMIATFTEKAAKELITRITNELYAIGVFVNLNEMYIGTFHSICLRILKDHLEYTRIKKNYRMLDNFEQQYMVFQKINRFRNLPCFDVIFDKKQGAWRQAGEIVKYVNNLAEELVDIDEMQGDADEHIVAVANIMKQYNTLMEDENLIDFSSIQTEAYKLLIEKPSILEEIQQKIKYVMVDEYQDTNYIQELLVFLIAGKNKNICVVGDDDQGLYRFRGATIRNILEFPGHFAEGECKQVKLVTNYRSERQIIDFYNKWMSTTDGRAYDFMWKNFRFEKKIVPPEGKKDAKVGVIKCSGRDLLDDWYEQVYSFITQLKSSGVLTDYNQIAVLCKSVKGDKIIGMVEYLEEHGIKVYSPRSEMFFERKEIKQVIGCMILCFPEYVRKLQQRDFSYDFENLYKYYDTQCIAAARKLILQYRDTLGKWIAEKMHKHANLRRDNADYAFTGLLYQLLQFEPFSTYLGIDMKSGVIDERPARNLSILSSILGKYEYLHRIDVFTEKNIIESVERFFNMYFRFLFDGGITEYEDDSEYAPSGCVSFMTIHQSKGMEFPMVIVDSYVNNKILPEVIYAYGLQAAIRNNFLKDTSKLAYTEITLVAEVAKYFPDIRCTEVARILRESEEGIDKILVAVNEHNDIIYDKIVPTIFEALYRVNKEIVKENVDVKLLKRPKEGGYYKFSGNEDLIIMQNSEDSVVVKNKDKSFHADTYVFDSKPELQLFLQLLANEHVKKAYFTGMFTADQTDFYVPYIDPESNRLRKYYPDFLVKMDDGSYLILEVKGDNMIDDPVVKAKGAAAEEVAVESSMKYEMLKGTDIMEGKAKF